MHDALSRLQLMVSAAAILAGLAVAPAARAASPPALTGLCASCHGANGISMNPTFPNIAGQKQGYIAYALRQYKAHQRVGAQASLMEGVAAQLSETDIQALAAYYASLAAQ